MATGAQSVRFLRLAKHAIVGLTLLTGALAVGNYSLETADCLRWPAANEFASTRAKPFGYWIARAYQNCELAPDLVIFGDSQLGGLRSADAKVAGAKLDFALDHRSYALESQLNHDGGEKRTFVLSQPGSLISDYLVISESLFTDLRKPKRVVLTVTPRVFLNNGLPFPGRSEYYRYFSSTVPLGAMYDLAFPTVGSRLHAVFQSMVRSPISTIAPGQFVFLPDDQQTFDEKVKMYPDNFSYDIKDYEHQIRFLDETLKFFQEQKIAVNVVSMPMLKTESASAFRKLQPGLSSDISHTCKKYDATFLDLTDDNSFSKEDFLDPIHLSQAGGEKFATVLAAHLNEIFKGETSRSASLND